MTRSTDAADRADLIAKMKRMITTGKYETIEKLEDAVDALLWSEHDRLQQVQDDGLRMLVQAHPK